MAILIGPISEGPESFEAILVPLDDRPGTRLLPETPLVATSREQVERDLEAHLRRMLVSVKLSEEETLQAQRLLASGWKVSIEVRKQSLRMILPSEARKLKLLPDYPGVVVIFAWQNRVELWSDTQWLQNLHACMAALSDKVDEYLAESKSV